MSEDDLIVGGEIMVGAALIGVGYYFWPDGILHTPLGSLTLGMIFEAAGCIACAIGGLVLLAFAALALG